ncbi:unnamed protein product [Cuscuta epithymum]|uniref:Uncharacterized protein n=1 Tax=Cuscuta epithymum TaxID=186058 RepID=A0AAV0C215_9ASTE|nr:unnamed protein product [Cuscuta epithymum]CAH9143367.1 unnamed protein product [Cuscuta epithymum]
MLVSEKPRATHKGFYTPPPKRVSAPFPSPASQRRPSCPHSAGKDLFHVIHKVPAGDSPYVRAKHVQLIEKDPSRAVSLFWAAINSGDRVESALKDMAVVMKQLNRSDEAIEAIKSFRHLSPPESQESIDNILVELYKRSGRIEDEIGLLELKLKKVEEGMNFGGKKTKTARSQGKRIEITLDKEYSRLLGNLAWAHMQLKNYKSAAENYRKALSIELDRNKQCNLAICLMHMNNIAEAKFLLQSIRASPDSKGESCQKSLEHATQTLSEIEKTSGSTSFWRGRNHSGSPVVAQPFTQPRRFSRKLYFENGSLLKTQPPPPSTTFPKSWRRDAIEIEPKSMEPTTSVFSCSRISSCDSIVDQDDQNDLSFHACSKKQPLDSACQRKKSWADIVEEEQEEEEEELKDITFETPCKKFNDENSNYSNTIKNHQDKEEDGEEGEEDDILRERVETLDVNGGYHTQPEEQPKCFYDSATTVTGACSSSSSLLHGQLNFGTFNTLVSPQEFDLAVQTPLRRLKRRINNRLQVFQDLTPA